MTKINEWLDEQAKKRDPAYTNYHRLIALARCAEEMQVNYPHNECSWGINPDGDAHIYKHHPACPACRVDRIVAGIEEVQGE